MSIIDIPRETDNQPEMMQSNNITIRSACGGVLPIEGQINGLKLITGKGETTKVDPFGVRNGPGYIILGIDAILKYPRLLMECLNRRDQRINFKATVNCANGQKQNIFSKKLRIYSKLKSQS